MFCFKCGGPLERVWLGAGPAPHLEEIAPACRTCGDVHYDGPAPVAGVIVRRGDEVLLVRPHGVVHHVLVSGFLKPGESIEEAAVREALEETGLTVTVRDILGTYSGAPLGRNIVLVVCVADVLGGELRRLETELADLAWFSLESLPAWPEHWPLARAFQDYQARALANPRYL